jgi:hypothetical protein
MSIYISITKTQGLSIPSSFSQLLQPLTLLMNVAEKIGIKKIVKYMRDLEDHRTFSCCENVRFDRVVIWTLGCSVSYIITTIPHYIHAHANQRPEE